MCLLVKIEGDPLDRNTCNNDPTHKEEEEEAVSAREVEEKAVVATDVLLPAFARSFVGFSCSHALIFLSWHELVLHQRWSFTCSLASR